MYFVEATLVHHAAGRNPPVASLTVPLNSSTVAYGLTADPFGNLFYAQKNGLVIWNGTASTATAVSLPYTPGSIAVRP